MPRALPLTSQIGLDAQCKIIRSDLTEIAADTEMVLRNVGLNFSVFMSARDSSDPLAAIAMPLDPSDDDWSVATASCDRGHRNHPPHVGLKRRCLTQEIMIRDRYCCMSNSDPVSVQRKELSMHRCLVVTLFLLAPMLARADQTIAGQWEANLGHNVIIAMDLLADGHWASQTVQNDKVVAEMAGTYEQKKESDTTGTLVFTPVKATTSAGHGKAEVETDRYTLQQDGHGLRLNTGNDAMEFHKQ